MKWRRIDGSDVGQSKKEKKGEEKGSWSRILICVHVMMYIIIVLEYPPGSWWVDAKWSGWLIDKCWSSGWHCLDNSFPGALLGDQWDFFFSIWDRIGQEVLYLWQGCLIIHPWTTLNIEKLKKTKQLNIMQLLTDIFSLFSVVSRTKLKSRTHYNSK